MAKSKSWAVRDSARHVFIIASEGGGSRASFWTSGFLKTLEEAIPGFFSHVYAASTVSGSSAGFSIYNNLYAEDKIQSVHQVTRGDFVSPANTAIFFGELFQTLSPCAFNGLDRSKYLEDAWSLSYSNQTGSHELNSSFLNFFNQYETLPVQFINSTVVERGQRVVISPVKLEDPDSLVFQLYDYLGHDIPFKTAMSLSARFPFLTFSGLLNATKETDSLDQEINLHLVDGGYYENTGIETALDIYNEIASLRMNNKKFSCLSVHLIYIQNSSSKYYTKDEGGSRLSILSHPLSALYNTWRTESAPMLAQTNEFFKKLKGDTVKWNDKDVFFHTKLPHDSTSYPLSRFIADTTQKKMIAEMENYLHTSDFHRLDRLLR